MTASIERQPNPFLGGAFPLLLVFLFFIFSGVMESLPVLPKLRPQLILAVFGLLAVVGTGQFVKVLRTPIGMCIALFTAWFIACIPFGAWPGGSFAVLSEQWYKAALIYFMTAGLLTTLPQANRLYRLIAYAVCILSLLSLLKDNRNAAGRLMLDNTRYANSNDLAWTLLVGLTFVGLLFLRGTRRQRWIAAFMAAPMMIAISRTGSRATMLGSGMLVIVLLVQAKRATRAKLMVAAPIVLLAIIVLMPKDMVLRFTTFFGAHYQFSSDLEERRRISAIESSENRRQLLIDSLIITMHHPLLGVGPGNFMVAQDVLAKARGDARSLWKVTHNTYTQLSSEMGLPGLIIYLVLLYNVFKVLNSIVRTRYPGPTWKNLRQLALTLRATLIVFLPVAFFGSMGYAAEVPILAGITTSLGFMAQKQRAIDRAASAEAVPAEPLLQADLQPVAVG